MDSFSLYPVETAPVPAPASVVASMWAWILSCLVPLLAVVYSVVLMEEVRAHLLVAATEKDPTATAESLDKVVNVTVWIALGALIATVVLVVLLAVVMINRKGWARFPLLLIGLLGIPAAGLAFGALSDDAAASRNNLTVGITAQAILVLIGAILMFLPAANFWFRARTRLR